MTKYNKDDITRMYNMWSKHFDFNVSLRRNYNSQVSQLTLFRTCAKNSNNRVQLSIRSPDLTMNAMSTKDIKKRPYMTDNSKN